MPIYAYKCLLRSRQGCAAEAFGSALERVPGVRCCELLEQVTAAGFQLKGNGWYVTDFRDNNKKKETKSPDASKTPDASKSTEPAAGEAAKPATETAKPVESNSTPASPPPPSTPTPSA